MSETAVTALVALGSALLSATITLVAVWLTNRHGERAATAARWWDRRFDAYSEAIRVAQVMLDVGSALQGAGILSGSHRIDLLEKRSKARSELSVAYGRAHFILSPRATEALFGLAASLIVNNEDRLDDFEAVSHAAKTCRDILIEEAQSDLGLKKALRAIPSDAL